MKNPRLERNFLFGPGLRGEVAKFSSEASRPENFDKVRFATGALG